MVGSWPVQGSDQAGVTVVEADDYESLAHVNNYYAGWRQFEWHPTVSGGTQRNQ